MLNKRPMQNNKLTYNKKMKYIHTTIEKVLKPTINQR
jgi:hypothetical protein